MLNKSNAFGGSVPSYQILNISKVTRVREQVCAVLKVPDIEDAELICHTWNNFKHGDNQKLKANVHSFSYRKRPRNKPSRHPLFQHLYVVPNVLQTIQHDGLKEKMAQIMKMNVATPATAKKQANLSAKLSK